MTTHKTSSIGMAIAHLRPGVRFAVPVDVYGSEEEYADVIWPDDFTDIPSWPEIYAAMVQLGNPVPRSVTPLQARKALRQAGMMDALNTWLATQPDTVTEVWEYALSIERDNPTLAAGAAALGLTDAQVDDLFRLAETL